MASRERRVAELDRGIELALGALDLGGDVIAHDGWIDAGELAAALGGGEPVLLRARRREAQAEDGFGAVPDDGVWLLVGDGALRVAPLRLEQAGAARAAKAQRVVVRVADEVCCDAPRCQEHKSGAETVVELDDGEELLVAETLASEPGVAIAPCAAIAVPLSEALGVECELPSSDHPQPQSTGKALTARELGRWSLGREGGLFVVRDLASRGPREAARRETVMAALMIVGMLASGYASVRAYEAKSWQQLAIVGAIAVVLALASFAMIHIARWSAKYSAMSAPLLWIARDRLVVSPWVSRAGAVDLRPEGRYGAALPLAEVAGITILPSPAGWTLGCTTEHGPFEIGTLESEQQARIWLAVLRGLVSATECTREPRATSRPVAARRAAAAMLFLLACACEPAMPPPPPVSTAADPLPVESSELPQVSAAPVSTAVPVAPPPRPKLPMIEDDLQGALAKAKSANKAVFVEVWAPWCHTCLSMKSFVLPDPAIVALGDRVVFAAIDSDRDENSGFMERYAVSAWPTLYVLDPEGKVLGMWQGAASVEELRDLIVTSLDARDASHDPQGPVAALTEAKRAHARRDYFGAARHYQSALDRGGPEWARRSDALYGLVFSEYRLAHWDRCAKLGAEHVSSIEGAALPADFSYVVLTCAGRTKNGALAQKAREQATARLRKHTESPPASSSIDDRADALNILSEALLQAGDKQGARAALEKQIALLEKAAADAPAPEAAATFDYQRMQTYLALGRGDDAVAMLRERARQQPDNYEPRARLAQALTAIGRHKEALAAIDDALAKSYGPRKLGYFARRAKIAAALGDQAAEKKSLEDLIQHFDKLEPTHQKDKNNREQVDAARARLKKLPK